MVATAFCFRMLGPLAPVQFVAGDDVSTQATIDTVRRWGGTSLLAPGESVVKANWSAWIPLDASRSMVFATTPERMTATVGCVPNTATDASGASTFPLIVVIAFDAVESSTVPPVSVQGV